jgi:hypothetical protein
MGTCHAMGRWSCSEVIPIVKLCRRGEFGSSIFLWPPPQEGEAALIVTNVLTAPAFVHAKDFAPALIKHDLNDIAPISAAKALELFLSLLADQLKSAKKFM